MIFHLIQCNVQFFCTEIMRSQQSSARLDQGILSRITLLQFDAWLHQIVAGFLLLQSTHFTTASNKNSCFWDKIPLNSAYVPEILA